MAKRKRSAALFEVFHDSKPGSAGAGLGAAPSRGWFKPRADLSAGHTTTAVDPNDPTTGSIRSALIAPRMAAVEAMESAAAASSEIAQRGRMGPARSSPATAAEARFHIDPDTREITFSIPFTMAIVGASAIVVCIGLAYVLGHHVGEAPAVAATNDQMPDDGTTRAIQPGALEVPRRAVAGQGQQTVKIAAPKTTDDASPRDRDSSPRANDVSHLRDASSHDANGDGPRIIGLNYLLIQVYPNLAGATEAREFLIKNGIGCTIEPVPDGFSNPDKTWLAVVSTRGFDRDQLHGADYNDFKHEIEQLSDKFSAKNKNKHFSIQPYKLK